jgi:hypothetical protein
MPTYQTRVLTARDRLLVDRLSQFPRYAALVERLTSGQKPTATEKPAKAREGPAATPPPAHPAKPALQAPPAVPKPQPKGG